VYRKSISKKLKKTNDGFGFPEPKNLCAEFFLRIIGELLLIYGILNSDLLGQTDKLERYLRPYNPFFQKRE